MDLSKVKSVVELKAMMADEFLNREQAQQQLQASNQTINLILAEIKKRESEEPHKENVEKQKKK